MTAEETKIVYPAWEKKFGEWNSEEEYLELAREWWTHTLYTYGWPPLETDKLDMTDKELVEHIDGRLQLRENTYQFTERMGLDTFGGLDVLDFGSGVGMHAVTMTENGARVTLCDIVTSNLEVAKRQLNARGLDAETFLINRFEDLKDLGMFDVIFACGSLQQIPPEFLGGVIEELKKHLRKDGKFVIMSYTEDDGIGAEGPYTCGFTRKQMVKLLGTDLGITKHYYGGSFQIVIAKLGAPVTVNDIDIPHRDRTLR